MRRVKSLHDCPFCGYALRVYTGYNGIVTSIVKGESRVKKDPLYEERLKRTNFGTTKVGDNS